MKTFLVLLLVHSVFSAIENTVDYIPDLSNDVVVPVTTNTVFLKKPCCVFINTLCTSGPCSIWLVATRGRGMETFDSDKSVLNIANSNSPSLCASSKNYTLIPIDLQNNSCPVTTPSYVQVGLDSCTTNNCNGPLTEGTKIRFKYILVNSTNYTIAETNQSDIITLKTIKCSDSLGSGYSGRSAAMVVITTILSVVAALLLLLLLIALILACCYKHGKTQTYETRRQHSVVGSLRIPSYDVHHLKNPSPYDNPAYEQDLIKKRYTTNSTLPQKTTTVITTVQNNPPDTITLQKM